MPLSEARELEARHAILAFAAEQDSRGFDWAELNTEGAIPALEGLADSTLAELLDGLVDDNALKQVHGDVNSWALPDNAIEPPEARSAAPSLSGIGDVPGAGAPDDELDDDIRVPAGPNIDADDWIRLPAIGDGKALAVIELDDDLVAALATIHPAERESLCAQINGKVRQVLVETRRMVPGRNADLPLVDYAELVVSAVESGDES